MPQLTNKPLAALCLVVSLSSACPELGSGGVDAGPGASDGGGDGTAGSRGAGDPMTGAGPAALGGSTGSPDSPGSGASGQGPGGVAGPGGAGGPGVGGGGTGATSPGGSGPGAAGPGGGVLGGGAAGAGLPGGTDPGGAGGAGAVEPGALDPGGGVGGPVGGPPGGVGGGASGAPTGGSTGGALGGGSPTPAGGVVGGGAGASGPSADARQWLGRWTGNAAFETIDVSMGFPTVMKGSIPVEIRLDDYRPNDDSGWVHVSGRISIGHCLLSAALSGQIFRGDDLSSVPEPRLSITAVGESDVGQVVLVSLAGQRTAPTSSPAGELVNGTLNLSSMDRRPPCTSSGLAFTISPVELVTRQ